MASQTPGTEAQSQTVQPGRIAAISLHTSPLDQPGTGDAGGMNVYIVEVAKRLAERGIAVDIFTRATSFEQPPEVELAPGVTVRNIAAGPYGTLDKTALINYLCPFVHGMLRAEAEHLGGSYDLVHTHYWLSGQAGWPVAREWGVPLVHSMHTMARVKNMSLAEGDTPELEERVRGEDALVALADRLIANTDDEAAQLINYYGASPLARLHRVPRGRPYDLHPRVARRIARAVSACPRTPSCCCSSAECSGSKPPTCCYAPLPASWSSTPACVTASLSQ